MNNLISTKRKLPMLLFLGIVAMGSGCSGSSDHEGPVGTARMEQGTIHPDDENDVARAHEDSSNFDENGAGRNGNASHSNNEATTTTGTAKVDDARNDAQRERKASSEELRGLRGKLVNELDGVRGRMKDGTRTAQEKNEDQARAAALAQGLEKLDRTLARIDASDDATWAQIRKNTNEEVKEMRAWLDDNEVDGVASDR